MDQPLFISAHTLIALVISTALLSAAIAFAAGTLSQPQDAEAQAARASSAASQLRKTNSQLRKANRTLEAMMKSIGTEGDATGPGLRKNTRDIARSIEALCREQASNPASC